MIAAVIAAYISLV